jgi:IPT/TIG domain
MSLGKRHIGRRVAGVGVAVALMMIGLAAPAFAAGPTVASFTPTSGPAGCVVDVTGTGFKASTSAQTHVFFALPPATTAGGGVEATSKFILSDTELWAEVPAGLTAGAGYMIRVENLLGSGTPSTTQFTVTTGSPGGCAPTITSFTPTCGVAGDVLKITGTNLLAHGDGTGGLVEFAPFVAGTPLNGLDATPTNPDISEPTVLQVTVPTGVADGPIQVRTFANANGGTVLSTTLFLTPPPDCVPAGGTTHARSISFKIKKSGNASGTVSSTEDPAFTDCVAAVPVKIQKKTSSGWKTVGKATTTDTGSYSKKVKNPKGTQKFRALAPKVSLGDPVTDVCSKAKSATRKV